MNSHIRSPFPPCDYYTEQETETQTDQNLYQFNWAIPVDPLPCIIPFNTARRLAAEKSLL